MDCPSGMIVDKTRKLSKRRLGVIIEALTARLSGEIDIVDVTNNDYEEALIWAQQKLRKMEQRK